MSRHSSAHAASEVWPTRLLVTPMLASRNSSPSVPIPKCSTASPGQLLFAVDVVVVVGVSKVYKVEFVEGDVTVFLLVVSLAVVVGASEVVVEIFSNMPKEVRCELLVAGIGICMLAVVDVVVELVAAVTE